MEVLVLRRKGTGSMIMSISGISKRKTKDGRSKSPIINAFSSKISAEEVP